ncbi:MAG: glycosyltransferase family 39 protein, partial [Patescibacteria group bacterium]
MNLLRKITLFKHFPKKISFKIIIFSFFVLLHLFLFNINTAEWGDSYRILRASEFVRKGTYPSDEKRPPLFSMILAIGPYQVDAVMWGRGVVFVFSILTLFVFDKLTSLFIKEEKYKLISLIIFTLNPVYLYWSLRIMSDVPFSFFALLSFYFLAKWKDNLSIWKSILIGLICGLAVLTRFEGYILVVSVFLGILFTGVP